MASPSPKPTARAARPAPRGERRNRDTEIIDAAIDIFWEKGFASTSVQDVADAVGLLKGSLYHYIASKDELLFRIIDESHQQGSRIIDGVRGLDLPALERLHIYLERFVSWYLANTKRVSVYFAEWRYLDEQRRAVVVDQGRLYMHFVRDLIEEAKQTDEISDAVNARLASYFITGAVNAVPDWYRRGGPEPADVVAASFADMAVSTLLGASAGSLSAPTD